jgi:hypothetical protein
VGAPIVHLRGTRVVRPLRQGDYSNLCGLYSLINAIQLSSWAAPANEATLRELHKFGINYLSRRRQLARVMVMGMDQQLWLELGSAIVSHSRTLLGMALELAPLAPQRARPRSSDQENIVNETRAALNAGRPVLCGLGGALEHYTVFSGYSEHRLHLFDSSGFHWIDLRSLGSSEHSGSRHWLYPGSLTVLVDAW